MTPGEECGPGPGWGGSAAKPNSPRASAPCLILKNFHLPLQHSEPGNERPSTRQSKHSSARPLPRVRAPGQERRVGHLAPPDGPAAARPGPARPGPARGARGPARREGAALAACGPRPGPAAGHLPPGPRQAGAGLRPRQAATRPPASEAPQPWGWERGGRGRRSPAHPPDSQSSPAPGPLSAASAGPGPGPAASFPARGLPERRGQPCLCAGTSIFGGDQATA